ncbi:ABC transporter substrate-binding protein [Halobellus salinisoli]|uniref:ABC transporter substrate-binding protein n=1 Tax=Halobellus salinisoli TaxID=3108500 RepID=UPI0030095C4D
MPRDNKEYTQQRRNFIKIIGGTGAIGGLAGCGGNGSGDGGSGGDGSGGSSENLGEPVEEVNIGYWTGVPGVTGVFESIIPTATDTLSELGVSLNAQGKSYPTQISQMASGERESDMELMIHGTNPFRLDPDEMLHRFGIDRVGNTGSDNPSDYPNCEYTNTVYQQSVEGRSEERQELINRAMEIRSNEYFSIPLLKYPNFGTYNSSTVNLNGLGSWGLTYANTHMWRQSEPTSGDSFTSSLNPTVISSRNFLTLTAAPHIMFWSHGIHQPLTMYNEDFELMNVLAESVEEANEGREVTVTLKDATFHNGDEITAEDVKFTFDLILGNPGSYPLAREPQYDEIQVVDDKTVRFTGEDPDILLQTARLPNWGILHSDSWREAGAMENPGEAHPDEIIGSGLWQIENFNSSQAVRVSPHEGHPMYGEDGWSPEHEIIHVGYEGAEAAMQAFLAEDLDVATDASSNARERINENDWGEFSATNGWAPVVIYPNCSRGPCMFPEFRHAIGKAMNRQRHNQLAYDGMSEPILHSEIYADSYPYLAPDEMIPEFTEDPTGDIEGARQVLSDAGWGWDDNGNLHYPPDADLSPVFELGGRPSPDEFSCLTEEGGEVVYQEP